MWNVDDDEEGNEDQNTETKKGGREECVHPFILQEPKGQLMWQRKKEERRLHGVINAISVGGNESL